MFVSIVLVSPHETITHSLGTLRGLKHSCIFRSVPVGTDGISRTDMQTGTKQPPIPPRVKFRGV
jgi:hypothetical protein